MRFVVLYKCDLPMIIYNVPGRTGVNILPQTAGKLARDIPTIVGIKEACGNLEQIAKTAEEIKGTQLQLMSGDDKLAVDIARLGGTTLISVASNALPSEYTKIMALAKAQKYDDQYAVRALALSGDGIFHGGASAVASRTENHGHTRANFLDSKVAQRLFFFARHGRRLAGSAYKDESVDTAFEGLICLKVHLQR